MLTQTIMGYGSDNTWAVEECISHGWGTTTEGKVDVFLSWHGKFERSFIFVYGYKNRCVKTSSEVGELFWFTNAMWIFLRIC